MCDYSLFQFPNRLAVKGEELRIHRFPCGSLGLATARRSLKGILLPASTCAVCVPPGARLLVHDISATLQRRLGVGPVEIATFVQQTADVFTYRDTVRFSNGLDILLQSLEPGQSVRVLSVDSTECADTLETRNSGMSM